MSIYIIDIQKGSEFVTNKKIYTHSDLHSKNPRKFSPPKTHKVSKKSINGLEYLSQYFEIKFKVTSTYRTKSYNNSLEGAAKASQHLISNAIDFAVPRRVIDIVYEDVKVKGPIYSELYSLGVRGIGFYNSFLHIDSRASKFVTWDKRTTKTPDQSIPEAAINPTVKSTSEPEVLIYIYSGEEIELSDLIQLESFPAKGVDQSTLLDSVSNGVSNNQRLYSKLTPDEKLEQGDGYNPSGDITIVKTGSVLRIPLTVVDNTGEQSNPETKEISPSYQSNIFQSLSESGDVFPEKIRQLSNDPGYIPAYLNRGVVSKKMFPQFTVVVWSRTLYILGQDPWVDISRYIESITTNVSVNGGNFSFDLPPVQGSYTDEDGWTKTGEVEHGEEYYAKSNINYQQKRDEGGSDSYTGGYEGYSYERKREEFYFQRILQQNDLVYIKFEQLSGEDESPLIVDNQWWDMIGLIDAVSPEYTASINQLSIQVSGRDLAKIFIEEDSHFDLYSIGHSGSSYNISEDTPERGFNGVFLNDQYTLRSIKDAMEFVFLKIANSQFIPDEVFINYPDRTKVISSSDGQLKAKGIWSVIKMFIDKNVADIVIADQSIASPHGSVLQQFKKICQLPFIEYYTDTYGDKFFVTVRRPPFDREAVVKITSAKSEVDSSSQRVGGITNTRHIENLRQTREENQRKFSSENENDIDLSGVTIISSDYPLVVNINEDDVNSDDLDFSTEAYSWYKIQDKAFFNGIGKSLAVPGVYLDEYAHIWGNRRMEHTTVYSDYLFSGDQKEEKTQSKYGENTAAQLRFLIETSAYLPFTRKGTIVVNGDRRIKKGQWIFYRPTREMFYVDGVTNRAVKGEQIDRMTTIQVSRGMVQAFIDGVNLRIDDEIVEVSYFNLVDLERITSNVVEIINGASTTGQTNKGYVNKKVFDYFLARKQFGFYKKR